MTEGSSTSSLPVPRFPDRDRRERLLEVCSRLEPIFRAYAEKAHMPGVVYGVVTGGELIFTDGFGVRSVDTQAPVDADTVFRIASMTKSFTALAVVKLRDRGQLSLDDPAEVYVPELATLFYPTGDTVPISVRQLLTMSAGWPVDDPWADRQLYRTDVSISDIYRAGISFSHPPGVRFEYSNLGYMVLGRIVTQITGRLAIDYITDEILHPLGMTATVWNATEVPTERLASGFRWQDEGWLEEPLLPSGGDVATFAGLYSSVSDLARWVALFQSAWPPRDEAENDVVGRSTLREMQQLWRINSAGTTSTRLGAQPNLRSDGYGYGLSIIHGRVARTIGHGGGLPGFGSHMRWAPDYDIGIVALANVTYANVHQACTDALDHLLTASQLQPRRLQPSHSLDAARTGVLRLLTAWDDSLADKLFADNFFLDQERSRWRQELEELRQKQGQLRPDGALIVESWLQGRWRMVGERGWCWVWILLAPTTPPLIQEMEIQATLYPSPAMQTAAQDLAALATKPSWKVLEQLFEPGADLDTLWNRVQLANLLCGSCTVHDVISGDGARQALFRFAGSKANTDVRLVLAENGDKLLDADFYWPRLE